MATNFRVLVPESLPSAPRKSYWANVWIPRPAHRYEVPVTPGEFHRMRLDRCLEWTKDWKMAGYLSRPIWVSSNKCTKPVYHSMTSRMPLRSPSRYLGCSQNKSDHPGDHPPKQIGPFRKLAANISPSFRSNFSETGDGKDSSSNTRCARRIRSSRCKKTPCSCRRRPEKFSSRNAVNCEASKIGTARKLNSRVVLGLFSPFDS